MLEDVVAYLVIAPLAVTLLVAAGAVSWLVHFGRTDATAARLVADDPVTQKPAIR